MPPTCFWHDITFRYPCHPDSCCSDINCLGVFLGSLAIYYGGLVDDIIMRASTFGIHTGVLLGMVIITVLGQTCRT